MRAFVVVAVVAAGCGTAAGTYEGGVFEDDRVRLEWWLRCGTPGT